jgi:hypothetical protein
MGSQLLEQQAEWWLELTSGDPAKQASAPTS